MTDAEVVAFATGRTLVQVAPAKTQGSGPLEATLGVLKWAIRDSGLFSSGFPGLSRTDGPSLEFPKGNRQKGVFIR